MGGKSPTSKLLELVRTGTAPKEVETSREAPPLTRARDVRKAIQKVAPVTDDTPEWLPERATVTIPSKFHKGPNVLQDIIQRYLSGNEYKVYDQLARLSWGGKERKNWTRIGIDGLRKRTGIQSRKGVSDATTALVQKRLVFYGAANGSTSNPSDANIDRNQFGTVYVIPIPTEGVLQNSTLWNSILIDSILQDSTLRNSILVDSTPGILNNSVLPNSTPESNPHGKRDGEGVLGNSILRNSPNKEDILKDSLSPDPVEAFYTGIGQKRISKTKREKGNKVVQELEADGFSLEEIAYAAEWTPKNAKEEVYDMEILKHTIGEAIFSRVAEQEAADATQKEAARARATEEERRRLEGEIQETRSRMADDELTKLRERALEEIRSTDGIKERFINEPLIVAKENEILRRKG